jgi:SAM-dependent methyltransferase
MPLSDRSIRRFIPAVPALSRVRPLMWPIDLLDRALCWPIREFRGLPPNHLRIRVGVGNRLFFNAAQFRAMPINFWLDAFAEGHATMSSRILDLGCGCGRFAMPLRDFWFHGRVFDGEYLGVDLDQESLDWCRGHFPRPRFEFHRVDAASRTYNPGAGNGACPTRPALPLGEGSRDFVLANSLFSHLLEPEAGWYLREAARVLRPGGWAHFSAFCIEHVDRSPRSRWSFPHRAGPAYVESLDYPEAAVAYEAAWLESACRDAGFLTFEALPSPTQTMVRCRR